MKTIGYGLADFPVLSETFVGDEIRASKERGHRVIPIMMHRRFGTAQTADLQRAETAAYPKAPGEGPALLLGMLSLIGMGGAEHVG